MMIKLLVLVICTTTALCQLGGRKPVDLKDENELKTVNRLASFGLEKIAETRTAELKKLNANQQSLKYNLIRVTSAKKQIVAGVKYYISLRMKEADCEDGCGVESCDLDVWEKPWENFTSLENFNCKKRHSLFGANVKISNNDEYALKALDFAVASINEQSNDLFYHKIRSVDKVYRKIVSGMNYTFVIKMGKTGCQKNANNSELKSCLIDEKAELKNCKITVWDQPWLNENRYKLVSHNCF